MRIRTEKVKELLVIGSLRGKLTSVTASEILIEVGGVGYEVFLSSRDTRHLHSGEDIVLYTVTNFSQDNLSLYGFLDIESKKIFKDLQKVSGVGPKAALALLSIDSAENIKKAIFDGNVELLTQASGIGKKGAQKIILELSGILAREEKADHKNTSSSLEERKIIDGLVNLGWNSATAQEALAKVKEKEGIHGDISADQVSFLLKESLQLLAKK